VGEGGRRGGGGAPADAPATRYGALLRGFRARRGLSLRAVGRAAGLHPQELSRSEAGRRRPADEGELLTLADALGLDPEERDELLAAAGAWPGDYLVLGPDDPTLRAVARVLASPSVPDALRAQFRATVDRLAASMLAAAAALGAAEAAAATAQGPGTAR
jgi:transcriptional regulator with XRE-family HTH domain